MMSSLMALLRMARSKSAVAPRLGGEEGRAWKSRGGGEEEAKAGGLEGCLRDGEVGGGGR